jgi:hypothetical protein
VLLLSPHPGRVKAEVASDGRDPALAARIEQMLFGDDAASHPRRVRE